MNRNLVRHGFAWLSFLLLFLFAHPVVAQEGTVTGVVTASTGEVLSAVQVDLAGGPLQDTVTVLTSSNGAYLFAGVPAGSYTLTFTLPGWEIVDDPVDVRGGQASNVNVVLIERSFSLNPITVTAGKEAEKVLEAPAAIEVISTESIMERPAITLNEHIKEQPAVDVASTGLQGNYTVIRGFNNIFSGQTMTMTDNRIARLPSLRANIGYLNPTSNFDVSRIEVLLGPASALYGPDAANGVIHTITKSPIDEPGLILSFAGGLRNQQAFATEVRDDPPVVVPTDSSDEFIGQIEGRYAWRNAAESFGFKVSGQYFGGNDFNFVDDVEANAQAAAKACQAANYDPLVQPLCVTFTAGLDISDPGDRGTYVQAVDNVAGGRDPLIKRWNLDGRFDFRPNEDTQIILSGGLTNSVNSIDLTGLGAAQVKSWIYFYTQARLQWKDLFFQVFYNQSDNSNTYLLRSGLPLKDKSSLFVSQIQNRSRIGTKSTFVYGLDFLRTVPRTDGTINGQNESDDDLTQYGGYLQYGWTPNAQWELLGAVRLDHHSRLTQDIIFSPRAALIWKPNQENSFRATYNRAFTTPTTLNLFLDISGGQVPLGGPFRYDIRAQGTTEKGFQFDRDANGIPRHMSPFNPLVCLTNPQSCAGQDNPGSAREFLPTTTEQVWAEAAAAVAAGDPTGGAGQILGLVPPPNDQQVSVVGATLNSGTQSFDPLLMPLDQIQDLQPVKQTTWQTFELGYSGLQANRLSLGVNGWYSRVEDFVSALRIATPNVFLNPVQTSQYLNAVLGPAIGGGLVTQEQVDALAVGLASVPAGVITPTAVGGNDAAMMFTYQNVGSFNLYGAELSATYLLTDAWELFGQLSLVDKNTFSADDGAIIALNAPKTKGALAVRFRQPRGAWNGAVRGRFAQGFPVNSGVYVGDVSGYSVFDVNVGYSFAQGRYNVQLDVQNVLDNNYQSFVGAPTLGRITMLRFFFNIQ